MKDISEITDTACERCVIGSLMMQANAYDDNAEYLSADLFTGAKEQAIYKAIENITKAGNKPDPMAVASKLLGSGITAADVLDIANSEARADLREKVQHLFDLSRLRLLYVQLETYRTMIGVNADPYQLQEELTNKLNEMYALPTSNVVTHDEVQKELYKIISDNQSEAQKVKGIPTGFSVWDSKGGLHQSDLVVIAADSSQGKTSLAINIAANAAKAGFPIAFYSMEMTALQLEARLTASEAKVGASKILYGKLGNDVTKLDKAIGKLAGLPIFYDDKSTSNIDSIIASIRAMKRRYNISGAFVDYLQILNVNQRNSNKEQAMGDAARRLKNLAKELDIFIVALSQLSRDRNEPEPSISRLRDSGQIAEAADVVILIYRPEIYGTNYKDFPEASTHETAEIKIAKGRNIGLSNWIAGFDAETTTFYELSKIPYREDGDEYDF